MALVFARCGGLLALAPPMNVRQFPVTVRVGIAAVLAVALAPATTVAEGLSNLGLLDFAALLVREAVVGALLGVGAALVLWGFTIGGQLLDTHLNAGDAGARSQGRGPMAGLLYLTAGAGFVAIDAHHWMLTALAENLQRVPIGGPVQIASGALAVAGMGHDMLMVGLAVAAPALAVMYAAEVALASFVRATPALGLAQPHGPVRWTAGLLGLAACTPLLAHLLTRHSARIIETIRELTILFAGTG